MNFSPWIRAYTNIALIKYWGKSDENLMIPQNNSLSLTLDAFYTETRVAFSEDQKYDELILDGKRQDAKRLKKALKIIDYIREQSGIQLSARIESKNYVPTAAGLASSASGLAALAGAASYAADLKLPPTELSSLARLGSGSACRSIYGGFAEWVKGEDHLSSHARPIASANWDLAMLFVIVASKEKEISSTEGMQHVVQTSPYYQAWLSSTSDDLKQMKQAIAQENFDHLGCIAESNALKMHALNLSARPPFNYWTAESIVAMDIVEHLRKNGYSVYFTMDAGPNVKVLCKATQIDDIYKVFSQQMPDAQLIKAYPGPGLQIQRPNGLWEDYYD